MSNAVFVIKLLDSEPGISRQLNTLSERFFSSSNKKCTQESKFEIQIENQLEKKQKKRKSYQIKPFNMIKQLVYIPINIFMNVFARVLQLFKI